MKDETLNEGEVETLRPERVTVVVQSDSGVLFSAVFMGTVTLALALDGEALPLINRALGMAGACVDFEAREGGAA